jgi:hypothetical protein
MIVVIHRHGLTYIDTRDIIRRAMGEEVLRRFDAGEEGVLAIRTRAACEAEAEMRRKAEDYDQLANRLAALQLECPAQKQAPRAREEDGRMKTVSTDYQCDQCGTCFRVLNLIVADCHLIVVMFRYILQRGHSATDKICVATESETMKSVHQ